MLAILYIVITFLSRHTEVWTQTNTVLLNVPAFTPQQEQAVKARFGQYVELLAVTEGWAFS